MVWYLVKYRNKLKSIVSHLHTGLHARVHTHSDINEGTASCLGYFP